MVSTMLVFSVETPGFCAKCCNTVSNI